MKKIIEELDLLEAPGFPIGYKDQDIKQQTGQVKGKG